MNRPVIEADDVGLRAGQEPPAVGVGAEPAGVVGEDRGGVAVGVDRDADELDAGPREPALEALHHAADPRARQRAMREDERGDPDAVGEVGVGDRPPRPLGQAEAAEREAVGRRGPGPPGGGRSRADGRQADGERGEDVARTIRMPRR